MAVVEVDAIRPGMKSFALVLVPVGVAGARCSLVWLR